MSLYLKQMQLGPMGNFVYLIGDPATKKAAVVDPAWNVPAILDQVKDDGYTLTHVFLSHGHYDHINGVEDIVEKTDATVCGQKGELEEFIADGMGGLVIPKGRLKKTNTDDTLRLGSLDVQFIHTPGHTPGSQCILVERNDTHVLMTGDTLFVGTVGRSDFPYSSPKDFFRSLAKLKTLDDETTFYPGHDYGASSSNTLKNEKKTNPFLLCENIDQFLSMVSR
jgi:hydroxyacylglutathione hydrolase